MRTLAQARSFKRFCVTAILLFVGLAIVGSLTMYAGCVRAHAGDPYRWVICR